MHSSKAAFALSVRPIKSALFAGFVAILMISGCASTDISRHEVHFKKKLPRPNHIWVYEFAATDEDVPSHSDLSAHQSQHTTTQTAHQIEVGRKVGALIADQLIASIREMGLPAIRGQSGTTPTINDLVLHGYLLSVVEGDEEERVLIGFGSGASVLKVAMEGFQMTPEGLRRVGSGTSDASGSQTPGGAAGVAALVATGNPAGFIVGTGVKIYGEQTGSSKIEGRVEQTVEEIAEIFEARCREQGWID
jgi:hypothetical protein